MLVATGCPSSLGGLIKGTVPAWPVKPGGNYRVGPTEEQAPDEEHCGEQWQCLRRWLARLVRPVRFPRAEMIRAYMEASGTWIGCD
jgi:hypothetical protein